MCTAFNLQSDRLYTVSEEKISVRSVMTAMQRILLDMAGIGDAGRCVGAFAVLSGNTGSTAGLIFYVAAGLDSMVLGEIRLQAGQRGLRKAAMEEGFSGTLEQQSFQDGSDGAAKRVKTETNHIGEFQSPTATLAVKVAEMYFGSLEG